MRGLVVFLACALLGACGQRNDPQAHCPGPRPAFRLQIRAFDGRALPADTIVSVEYGGDGRESYRLATPPTHPQVLFCNPSSEGGAGGQGGAQGAGSGGAGGGSQGGAGAGGDAGAGGEGAGGEGQGGQQGAQAEARLVACELWTDGAANVTVEASGLTPYRASLAATTDKCGVATSLLEIELAAPVVPDDGGSP